MDTPREKAQDPQIKDRAERKKKQARSRFGLSRSSSLFRLFAVLGPGLIAANAGNDAGGIATFSQAGASYQYSLLWALAISGFCSRRPGAGKQSSNSFDLHCCSSFGLDSVVACD